jgi:hypothetical protein
MLPNLIIIGGMKCGTTSLHYYLSQHPEISMSRQKELDFFVESKNWVKGLDWYESQFKTAAKVIGEASPNYTSWFQFPQVPARMHQLLPNAKLIYVVRHPIDRMIAHYIHNYSYGREDQDIDSVLLNGPMNRYLDRSLYYSQLSHYLEYYDPSQILVVSAKDLKHDTLAVLETIFKFLNVDPTYRSDRYSQQHHQSATKRRKTPVGEKISRSPLGRGVASLPWALRNPLEQAIYRPFSHAIQRPTLSKAATLELNDRLRDDVAALRRFTGHSFQDWQI